MENRMIEEEFHAIQKHLDEIRAYFLLINDTQFYGRDSKTVESLKSYFFSVKQQLEDHLETLSKKRLGIEE